MVTYITAQYRYIVVCDGLYTVRAKSLHGRYSSGCIESAMQPSPMEKSSRTTLHYDSARDLASGLFPVHTIFPLALYSSLVSSSSKIICELLAHTVPLSQDPHFLQAPPFFMSFPLLL